MHRRRERAPVSGVAFSPEFVPVQMLMAGQTPYFQKEQETRGTVLTELPTEENRRPLPILSTIL